MRRDSAGRSQLLTLSFALDPDMPLRLPEGTLHANEDPVLSLAREVWEEVGLEEVVVTTSVVSSYSD